MKSTKQEEAPKYLKATTSPINASTEKEHLALQTPS